jgi:hypothetical protein
MRTLTLLPLGAVVVLGLAAAGCTSKTAGTSAASMIPPPASGAAWRVVGQGGQTTVDGTAPAGSIQIGQDGSIRASIPPSAQSQQAGGALAPGSFGALQIRNAP